MPYAQPLKTDHAKQHILRASKLRKYLFKIEIYDEKFIKKPSQTAFDSILATIALQQIGRYHMVSAYKSSTIEKFSSPKSERKCITYFIPIKVITIFLFGCNSFLPLQQLLT